jgi:hypothetical protein
MAFTDRNFLLISMHGAQDPNLRLDKDAFNKYMIDYNKKAVEDEASKFLGGRKPRQIFIMGDFNDRYDAIKNIRIGRLKTTYKGVAPKSCCYNWDSSCEDGDVEIDFGGGYKTCRVPDVIMDPITGKLPLYPVQRGHIKNYRYAGDKVFGLKPLSEIEIYRPGNEEISTESDHELVFSKFENIEPTNMTVNSGNNGNNEGMGGVGGRRKKTRKNKNKKRKTKRRR